MGTSAISENNPTGDRGPTVSHPLKQNVASYPWGYHPARRSPLTPPAMPPSLARRS